MAQYYSRLQRRYEKLTQKQTYLLFGGSAALLVLIIVFGIPLLFNLTGVISGLRQQKSATTAQDEGLAPAVPRFSESLVATKSAQISVSGVADGGVSVEIYQDDLLLGTTIASNDGSFKFAVTLNSGANQFQALAASPTGKKSAKSEGYVITYSNKPPKLNLAAKDRDTIKDNPFAIAGSTDPNTSVVVNDHQAIVNSDGTFTYLVSLSNGDNKIKVVVTDQAGNQTTKEITLKYNP